MKLISLFLFSCVLSSALLADNTAPTTTDSTVAPAKAIKTMSAAEQKLKDEMFQLFELSKKVNAPNSAEKHKARSAVENTMDWDQIAKDCLGPELLKKNASQFGEFKKLLKEVIELTAYTRLDKFWGTGVTFSLEDVSIAGKNTKVVSHFLQPKDQSELVLEYFLSQKGKWLIYDISFEGEQYSKNIREQIEAFLGEKKRFSFLLDKLRKKKKDLLEDSAKPKAKAEGSTKKSG